MVLFWLILPLRQNARSKLTAMKIKMGGRNDSDGQKLGGASDTTRMID